MSSPQQPFAPQPGAAPKKSVGKKIGIGCGAVFAAVIALAALGAAVGDSKGETASKAPAPSAPAVAKSSAPAPATSAPAGSEAPSSPKPSTTRPTATLAGVNLESWTAAMQGQGIEFESKGEQYAPPGGGEAFKDWKGKNQSRTSEGLYLKATATAYASDGAVLNVKCKAQEGTGQEAKITGFFEKCVTSLAVPGLDSAQAAGFVKEHTARLIASSSSQPATATIGGVTLRIDDDLQAGAAEITITANR
ncbi:hypothetical protein ACFV9E_36075 [Streptomyces sp. NPDC059835]|uniref:hypothetical protein n=1 Tax=Streptomyces sp. NPDC059835 TaxID=3346967 RepID=UPI00364F63CE